MGHGGGQHKKAPGIVTRASRFVAECGFAVAAVDVPAHGDRPKEEEYDRLATENQVRVEAGEERAPPIARFQSLVARRTVPEWQAVLDARIIVPAEFLVQWDDERVPRAQCLELFDALASPEKTLHTNPGKHGEIPAFEQDSTLRFFARHLG